MKRSIRIPALLLVLTIIFSLLGGCKTDPTSIQATTDAQSDAPTEAPQPEPRETFALAASSLEDEENLTLKFHLEDTIHVGNDTITELTDTDAWYHAYGSPSMMAHVNSIITNAHIRAAFDQYFADGICVAKVKEAKYYAREDETAFLKRQLPPLLLHEENFRQVRLEGTQYLFEDAEQGEPWAIPEDGELLSAKGSAELVDGTIRTLHYEISFRYGGSTVERVCDVDIEYSLTEDLKQQMPENTKGCESLDSIEAALLMLRARNALESATVCSTQSVFTIHAQAAGLVGVITDEVSYFGSEEDFLECEDYAIQYIDYIKDQNDSYTYSDIYRDGTLTFTNDDNEPEEESANADAVLEASREQTIGLLPGYAELVDASIRDLGDYSLVEFTCNENYANTVKATANQELFGGPTTLDGYSTGYNTKSVKGYLAVEKYTHLPTALSIAYEGIYTIDDSPTSLELTMTRAISLYDPDTYEKITEEPLPDHEPEQAPTPLFYEVTGPAGEKLYLFGTIHVGDDRTAFLPQKVYDAFDGADALAVEFDDSSFTEEVEADEELQTQLLQAYFYTDGTTIANHLDSELYEAAVLLMKASGQYTNRSDSMRPFVWSSILDDFYLSQGRSLTSSKGVDHRLMARAREQEKEILNVESGIAQLELLAGYSDQVQQMLLAQSLNGSRNDSLAATYALYELWCDGDEQALIDRVAAMSDEERENVDADDLAIYDEYHSKMEVERNQAMLDVARGYLDSGKTVFFAVGIAHMLGEAGLVQALRDEGYTVTLIDTKS